MEINDRSGDWLPPDKSRRKPLRVYACLAWGTLFGALTFAVGPISSLSDNPILSALQTVAMVFIIPGLIGSMAISQNVHAFSLAPAALINTGVHFGVAWAFVSLFARLRRKKLSQGNA